MRTRAAASAGEEVNGRRSNSLGSQNCQRIFGPGANRADPAVVPHLAGPPWNVGQFSSARSQDAPADTIRGSTAHHRNELALARQGRSRLARLFRIGIL